MSMASGRTGKQRAARIPLDYFRHRNPMESWKRWLAIAAAVLVVGWFVLGLRLDAQGRGIRFSSLGRMRASRGPVARVHAAWETNCEACHAPFSPISGDSFLHGSADQASASDQRCQRCHLGPPHHENQLATSPLHCASCHRDHRGRDASLVRLPDQDCTTCHGNLAEHTKTGSEAHGYANVTSFPDNHPEFAATKSGAVDPGRLKFNHALHMTEGMVATEGGTPLTLAYIADPKLRERYRKPGQTDDAPLKLECASCHQTDAGASGLLASNDLSSAVGFPARSGGATMLPITYENQCRACHPLTVEPKGADEAAALTVPHRLQPDALHTMLEQVYTSRYVAEHPDLVDQPLPPSRVPGKPVEPGKPLEQARAAIQDRVLKAEQVLYLGKQTCAECHHYQDADGPDAATRLASGKAPDLKIQAPDVPEVWFQHAQFNHQAHRAVNCRECHAGAYPKSLDGTASLEPGDTSSAVLVPGRENCLQCHAPSSTSGGELRGGVAYDCTECHRYHNGDRPLEGLSTAHRAPTQTDLDVQQFLTAPAPAAAAAETE